MSLFTLCTIYRHSECNTLSQDCNLESNLRYLSQPVENVLGKFVSKAQGQGESLTIDVFRTFLSEYNHRKRYLLT